MLSIRKQRQIRFTLIVLSTLVVLLALIIIIGFYPFGLHKRNMKNVPIPKDSLLYVSAKSVNDSVSKVIDSIYAYRISHDEAMLEFSSIINLLDTFLDSISNSDNIYLNYLSKYIYSRNIGVLFWALNQNSVNDSEIYFLSDLGRLPSLLLNLFLKEGDFSLANDYYQIRKSNYRNTKINYLNKNDEIFIIFTSFKGLLIVTRDYGHITKMIDFFNSKPSNLTDISIFQGITESYSPDMSLYINKKEYDSLRSEKNTLFDSFNYFKSVSSIYAYSKVYDDRALLDFHIDYEYGASDRAILYSSPGASNIQRYLSSTNTAVYFGLSSEIASLYPILLNDIKSVNNGSKVYDGLIRLNRDYSLNNIVKELRGESSFIYLKDTNNNMDYPAIAFEIESDTYIVPLFEDILIKKYGQIEKLEKSYRNNFIYTYVLNNNKNIHYTYKNNIIFASEYGEAIEILIDGFYDKYSLSSYLSKKSRNIKNTDYILILNFPVAENIIKSSDLPFRNWSYPKEIIAGSTIGTNSTHVEIVFYADLENRSK